MLEKYGKSWIYFVAALVIVAGIWGFLAFQLFAGRPFLTKYSNDEIEFKYPRWTSGSGYVVKTENPIRGAGIEVAKKADLNLPLSYWADQTEAELVKDRKLISKDVREKEAVYTIEFSNSRGEFQMKTKVVTAGENLYVLSGYSLKKKLAKNQRTIDDFLNSVQVKKEPLFAKPDLAGTILRNLDNNKFQGYSDKGEVCVLILSKEAKVYDENGEIKKGLLGGNKYPDFAGKKFIALGSFATNSKLEFNVDNLVVY